MIFFRHTPLQLEEKYQGLIWMIPNITLNVRHSIPHIPGALRVILSVVTQPG